MKRNIITLGLVVLLLGSFACAAADKPIQVFILAGQSNMEGKARLRVMEHQAFKGDNKERYKKFTDGSGKWKTRDDVWIKFLDRHGKLTVGYGSPRCCGPELDFGFTLGDYVDAPVLLIKTAWGGKTLGRDFRPPSSGYPDDATLKAELDSARKRNPKAAMADIKARYGHYYREMVKEVRATLINRDTLFPELKGKTFRIAGFVWFQGWNEQYNDTYIANYDKNLQNLIRDVRKEFKVPKMPFIVGEFGCDGPKGRYVNQKKLDIRKAQAAFKKNKEFDGNADFVSTTVFWDYEIEKMYEDTKKIRRGLASGKMTKTQAQAIKDRFAQHGSDKGYHYLGSPKIYCDMGRAFAQGMIKLLKGQAK
ncbi:MAG: sialate O-acetylesterase [Phycisphaerae bacterium]|jgi:alpha-galactosidase|nr:sialate O-acetylesterase [Phycisphaerae bacterium]